MLALAAFLVAALSVSALSAFATHGGAHPHAQSETGPGDPDGATQPGTCVETERRGANVTTTTHKGNCDSQGGQRTGPTTSKQPPGQTTR